MAANRPARRLTVRRAGPDGERVLLRLAGGGDEWTAWSAPGDTSRSIDAREVRALLVAAAGGLGAPHGVSAPPLVLQAEELRELATGALAHEHNVAIPDSVRPVLATLRGIVDAEVFADGDQVLEAVSWLDGGPAGCWVVEPAEEGRVVIAPGGTDHLVSRLLGALDL